MAKLTFIDINDGEYTVQRDDGSMYKRFNNFDEAKSYEAYLQQLDDQGKVVQQNDEIIANQKRLIEAQERNNRMPQRPPMPQVTRQILDPEYREWLRFQKETNPEYKKWKKEQEAAAARENEKRATERAAEEARLKAQRAEEEKKKQLEEQRVRSQKEKLNKELEPFENALLAKEKLAVTDREKLAKLSSNQSVLNRLQYDSAVSVLKALLTNPNANSKIIQKAREKLDNKEKQRILRREAEQGGCFSVILLFLIPSALLTLILLL